MAAAPLRSGVAAAEPHHEPGDDLRASSSWLGEAIGVSPSSTANDDSAQTSGGAARFDRFARRFAVTRIAAFARGWVRDGVDRTFVAATGAPLPSA